MSTKTKTVSRRTKIVVLILFEMYVLVSAVLDYFRYNNTDISSAPTYDSTLLYTGIFFSFYALALAWFIEPLFRLFSARAKRENHIFTSDKWKMILSYLFMYSPDMFGRILLPMGFSFSQYYYFLAATVLFAIVWGVRDLRRNSSTPNQDESNNPIES
jgi:hypothetical protein